MMKKLILITLIISAMAGCSVEVDDGQVEPPKNTAATTTPVGPYTIAFDPQTKTYSHTAEAKIEQNEGYIKYLIHSPTTKDIELVSSTVNVQGCDSKVVSHQIVWIPEDNNFKIAQSLTFGKRVYTAQNKTGAFIHHFEKLNGCTNLKITTVFKEHLISTRVGQACNYTNGCVITAECKYQYSDKTIDSVVAYRDAQGSYMVQKSMMDPATGNETVSTAFSASMANEEKRIVFQGNGMSFSIDKLTYESTISYGGGMSDTYDKCNYKID